MKVRFGIIADIHANLEALTVALDTLEKEKADQIICLGDIIGYGADPVHTLSVIKDRQIPTIRGNHERYIVGETHETLKDDTLRVTEWTRGQLAKEHYEFIEQMPNKMQHETGFLITHGSPRNKDEYLLKLGSFVDNLKLMEEKYPETKICFHGHTHLPSVMARGHMVQTIHEDTKVSLDKEKIYLINPGSVGQPRDHCPLSSCGIYDNSDHAFYFYRRPYDMETTMEKIYDLELAPRFAERLLAGK